MSDSEHERIIIEGVTESGEIFRPSDWAERLSGSLCMFRNRRMVYSPLLQPTVEGGNKCVILDTKLKQSNPTLYQSILDFALANKLKMHKESE